ncbi:hypothetical protein SteCoe_985 [Stentor coeruleus]|uniref:Uncharacterized protein n=1 Tax=Stentor coeruleus TaxID=5963 RepID=A0A1R2D2X1_9CILI|nr:hypothetical protein SteCoe_985 [Stentor coeruleus]
MELKIAKLDYRIFLSCFIWLQVFVIVLNLISITNSDWKHYYYGLAKDITGKFFITCLGSACYSDELKMLYSGAIYIILSCISMTLIYCWIKIVIKSFKMGKTFNKGICLGIIALILQIVAFIAVFSILEIKFYAITEEKFENRADHAGTGAQMAIVVILIEFFLLIVACTVKSQVNKIQLTKVNNVEEKNTKEISNLEINGQEINEDEKELDKRDKGKKKKKDKESESESESESKEINSVEKTKREKKKDKREKEKMNNGSEKIDLHEEKNLDVKVKIKKKKMNDESQE